MRGSSHRGAGSGTGLHKEIESLIPIPHGFNKSLFVFLQDGCFDRNLFTFCANRLLDYSCVYWHEGKGRRTHKDPHKVLSVNFTAKFPSNKPLQDGCYHVLSGAQDSVQIFQIILPLIFLLCLMANGATFWVLRRMGQNLFPICFYLCTISCMDCIDCLWRSVDTLLNVYVNINITVSATLFSRSLCRILPALYNMMRHFVAMLYVGQAMDLMRFAKDPTALFRLYRFESFRNVLLLSVTLSLIINAQFFWTFDMSQGDTSYTHLHPSEPVFVCDFATNVPLNRIFINFIWPLVDYVVGDVGPSLVTLLAAWKTGPLLFNYRNALHRTETAEKISKVIIAPGLLLHVLQGLTRLQFLYVISTLLRAVYFAGKFYFFASTSLHLHPGINPQEVERITFNSWAVQLVDYHEWVNVIDKTALSIPYIAYLIRFWVIWYIFRHVRIIHFGWWCTAHCSPSNTVWHCNKIINPRGRRRPLTTGKMSVVEEEVENSETLSSPSHPGCDDHKLVTKPSSSKYGEMNRNVKEYLLASC